jgi:hypothetical protein
LDPQAPLDDLLSHVNSLIKVSSKLAVQLCGSANIAIAACCCQCAD